VRTSKVRLLVGQIALLNSLGEKMNTNRIRKVTSAIGIAVLLIGFAAPNAIAEEPAAPATAEEPAAPATAEEPAAPATAEEPAAPATAEEPAAPATAEEPAAPVTPTYAPGMAPGEHGGWAVVDETGRVVNSGFVCTPNNCGSDPIPGYELTAEELATRQHLQQAFTGGRPGWKVVVATTQDPVGAATSENGIGNVVGGTPSGQYDHNSGQWINRGPGGTIHVVPLSYGGIDPDGNRVTPILVFDPTSDDVESGGTPALGSTPGDTSYPTVPMTPERQRYVDALTIVVTGAISSTEDLEATENIRFTEVAANRRTSFAFDTTDSLINRNTASSVDAAQKLLWVYVWAAVRDVDARDKDALRTNLRTTRVDSTLEREVRALAAGLAKADLANTLNAVTPDSSALSERCATYLVNGQGKLVREHCLA